MEDRDDNVGLDPTINHENDGGEVDSDAASAIEDLLNDYEVDNLEKLKTAIENREEQPHDRAKRLPKDVRVNLIQTHLATAAFMHSTFNDGFPVTIWYRKIPASYGPYQGRSYCWPVLYHFFSDRLLHFAWLFSFREHETL